MYKKLIKIVFKDSYGEKTGNIYPVTDAQVKKCMRMCFNIGFGLGATIIFIIAILILG